MKYGCTVIWATKIGDFVLDRESGKLEYEEYDEEDSAPADDDHSDEQFDRMDRQNELR